MLSNGCHVAVAEKDGNVDDERKKQGGLGKKSGKTRVDQKTKHGFGRKTREVA